MLWLQTFAHEVRERIEEEGFVVLGLDRHGPQMMYAFQARAKELKIVLSNKNSMKPTTKRTRTAVYEADGISAKTRRKNSVTWAVAAW